MSGRTFKSTLGPPQVDTPEAAAAREALSAIVVAAGLTLADAATIAGFSGEEQASTCSAPSASPVSRRPIGSSPSTRSRCSATIRIPSARSSPSGPSRSFASPTRPRTAATCCMHRARSCGSSRATMSSGPGSSRRSRRSMGRRCPRTPARWWTADPWPRSERQRTRSITDPRSDPRGGYHDADLPSRRRARRYRSVRRRRRPGRRCLALAARWRRRDRADHAAVSRPGDRR